MKRWHMALLAIVAGAVLAFPAYRLGAQPSASFALSAWGLFSGGGASSSLSFSSQTSAGEAVKQSSSGASFALGPAVLGPLSQVNRPPSASNDTIRVVQDSAANPINVLGNDSDPDGDPVRVISVTQGTRGSVSVASGGSVLYTPEPGFTGTDSFSYTVSDGRLTVTAIVAVTVASHSSGNQSPLASGDSVTVQYSSADNVFNVLANDSDPDGDALKVIAVVPPSHGTALIGSGGASLLYSPQTGFVGLDTLVYTISDGHATSTATVAITVSANRSPVVVLDRATVPQNSSSIPINVLANDSDPEGRPLMISGIGQPSNGSVSVGPGGAYLLYAPRLGFFGIDSFDYTVSDGSLTAGTTVIVVVNPVNNRPIASDDTVRVAQNSVGNLIDVLSNDGDPDNNPLAIASVSALNSANQGSMAVNQEGTKLIYTPPRGFTGSESYLYSISDGVLTDTATIAITVQGGKVFLPLLHHGPQGGAGQ